MAAFTLILLFLSLHAASRDPQHGKDVDPRPGILPLASNASNRKLLIILGSVLKFCPQLASISDVGSGVEGEKAQEEGGAEFKPYRIGDVCSEQDVALHQAATTPLPSGIPTYTVRIINVCVTGCSISDVHLACGWFSTARSINPAIFRRLRYNDCLVNDGKPIPAGGSVSFQYANTFPYTLSVSSATCNP
ncbi:TAPETUM DETERMINANT 1 protein [Nymphaea thermarum]|nr:TAPETUM DETERMINANT 1 protein [Nymphaea thermarum]